MAMNKDMLHQAIKTTAEGYISKHLTYTVEKKKFVSDNGVITEDDPEREKTMHPGLDGVKDFIDIIAEAVAQEVILHIQNMAEIQSGVVTTATLPYTVPLNGAGGGVPGPVVIPPAALIIAGGTINVAQTGIK